MIKTVREVNKFVLVNCEEMLKAEEKKRKITFPNTKSSMLLCLLSEKEEVKNFEKEEKCIFSHAVDFPNADGKKAALFFFM